jgi:hypothetical protein
MEAAERTLVLNPESVDLNQTKAMILLAQGDLAGAQGVLKTAVAQGDPTAAVAYVGNFRDLFWCSTMPSSSSCCVSRQPHSTATPPGASSGLRRTTSEATPPRPAPKLIRPVSHTRSRRESPP